MFDKLLNRFIAQVKGEVTEAFLGLLLTIMSCTLKLSRGYRANIKNFQGRYAFATADGTVENYVVFQDDRMKVHDRIQNGWDVSVTFKNAAALINFLFSRNQDIVGSILANDVTVDGNLNYLYKFGFMARDLLHRLGAL